MAGSGVLKIPGLFYLTQPKKMIHSRNENQWPSIIGLIVCCAAIYAVAWQSAPENRPTRDKILNTLASYVNR